ncbi:hypothetical protein TNCV_4226191 [Trichonephila clavipes]|uniref:Uncharacterized protein n=1 Tax=Trichonephila clavipes TaxID=2585209 RepID=A0A8X6SWM3_TRICX|nr:hypothetical protein TNCV_4226191 [Trichonephila clavipes]
MLKRVIVTEWNTISSEETPKLVQSIPKRLMEVLRPAACIAVPSTGNRRGYSAVFKACNAENGRGVSDFR